MTDFSRNQISSAIGSRKSQIDRWVIPNDRQLSLRAKLGTGWSVRSNNSDSYSRHHQHPHSLTDEELHHITRVVNKASSLEHVERQRIGTLVNHYHRLKERCQGDGAISCFLCGVHFRKFRTQSKVCSDCENKCGTSSLKAVCSLCYVDTLNSNKEKLTLCKICSEKRELWKKSGAWFFGTIPPHIAVTDSHTPAHQPARHSTPQRSPTLSKRIYRGDRVVDRDNVDGTSVNGVHINVTTKSVNFGVDDSDEDSDESETSYCGSQSRFRPAKDPDMVSISSQQLIRYPLTGGARSNETINTLTNEEFSGTESSQDLRLISLKPTTPAPEDTFAVKPKSEVTFHPDTVSQTSGGFVSGAQRFEGGIPRCISIPNADLKDVDYYEEEDTTSPFGSLMFSTFYQEHEETLVIEILGAQHLPATSTPYNPYVSVNLVPSLGHSRKQRTTTEHNTLKPRWNQKISYFGISMDELLYKSLVFSVMDEHLISSDDVIAEHRMPLREIKSYEFNQYQICMERKVTLATDEAVVGGDERGKILLSVRYDTNTSQLHVGVVRCAALHIPNQEGFADPYVKLYLLPDDTKTSKKKTMIKKRTLNPEFHEELVYKVPLDTLADRSLEVTVWNHNMTRNMFLGGVCLAMNSRLMSEKNQWSMMVDQPNRRHDSWHMLRDIINK